MAQESGHEQHPDLIPISIDKEHFKAPKTPMTGAELRALPNPDVSVDRDLWLDTHGPADDILVTADQSIDLMPGMHFYTAPSNINPGFC